MAFELICLQTDNSKNLKLADPCSVCYHIDSRVGLSKKEGICLS